MRIGTSNNYLYSPGITGAGSVSTWSFHFFMRAGATPSTGRFTYGLSVRDQGGSGSNPDFGFVWDHSSTSFQRAVINRRANNSYDAAKTTTAMAANTTYSVAGTMDGSNLRCWLDGVNETTVTSAAPGANLVSANILVQQGTTATNPWPDGEIGEVALWINTVLTGDEIAALAKGFDPTIVKPRGLQLYCPLVRNSVNLIGYVMTDGGTPAWTNHPRVFGK